MKKHDVESKVNKYLEAFGGFVLFINKKPLEILKADVQELKFKENAMFVYFKADSKHESNFEIPYYIIDSIE